MGWGTLAEWATVLIAAVAAWIAVRTYRQSVWDTKVATARLVWPQKELSLGWSEGKQFSGLPSKFFPRKATTIGAVSGHFERREENGETFTAVTRDLTVFLVRVTNNSKEPIANVRVSLEHPRFGRLNPSPVAFKVLPPESTRLAAVFGTIKYNLRNTRATRVRLTFYDSAGHKWTRVGVQRPKELSRSRPPRFQKLRAWKFRTMRSVRQKIGKTN